MAAEAADVFTAVGTTRRVGRNGALAVAAFGAFLAFLDATIVNVAFPNIRSSFGGSSIAGLSWVLNAYNIVFAAFLVVAGRLADLVGRRRVFTSGIVLFTLASAACAAAPSLGLLIAGRVVQAAGAALLVPASLALVVHAFPPERRAHAAALWGAAAAAAAGLGPPLGGALVRADGWRLVFLVNVPLGIGAVAASRRLLIESRAPGRRALPDGRGALLLAAAVALVTLAIVEGGAWGWGSVRVAGAVVLAAAAAAAFAWSSRRHPEPVLDPQLLRLRSFSVANVATAVAGLGFYAYLLNNVLWLHYVWGWSLLQAGLALAPGALVAAAVARPLGRVADVRGDAAVAVPGALVWAGAYVWYATQVGTHPAFFGEWLPGQVLSGLGVGATLPILGGAALRAVPGGRYAAASSITASTRQLGGVLGVAVLVAIVGTPTAATIAGRLRHGWWFSAAAFIAVAACTLLLRREGDDVVESDGAALTPRVETAPTVTRSTAPPRSLFAELPQRAREDLLQSGERRTVRAGEVLFRQGDDSDALYVVRAGRLAAGSGDVVFGELGAGEVVGELGVLARSPRSATVVARRDTSVVRIDAETLERVLSRHPEAGRRLTAVLAERLQRSKGLDRDAPAPARVVSVLDTTGGDGAAFAALLESCLARHLRVASPGRVTVDGLDRAERDHDRVLLSATLDHDGEWRSFCARQADRLVLVGASDSEPPFEAANSPAYVVLRGLAPPRDRLLAWWALPGVRRVIVAPDDAALEDAAERIAARLAGASVGLALAGGGARAFASIGVLHELERAGIDVDRIAGTSLGAIVAVLHASGLDAAGVDAVCFDEFVRRNPFGDFTLPRTAIARGGRARAALERSLGDTYFEELPREVAVVSTDLLERRPVVHRRGRVQDALRASFALPGLFPPARLGDSLHVDGTVLNNLPVDALDADEGPILAVNISAGGGSAGRGGRPRMPTILETLLRSMLMGSTAALDEARRRATVVVTPDTRGIGLLEFHQLDRAVEAGRAAGRAAVAALAEDPGAGERLET